MHACIFTKQASFATGKSDVDIGVQLATAVFSPWLCCRDRCQSKGTGYCWFSRTL